MTDHEEYFRISGVENGARLESRVLEELIQKAVAKGERRILVDARGQHGIGGRLWNAQGEGSAGPLDLFADVERAPGDRGFWHRHILPRLSAFAEVIRDTTTGKGVPPKPTEVIVRVSDAGDPVAGATVTIGGKAERTDADGRARFTLATHGPFRGTVAAEGYERGAVSGRS